MQPTYSGANARNQFFSLSSFILIILLCFSCQQDEPNVIDIDGSVMVKTNVKLTIGEIVYENVDATITISSFDSKNVMQWIQVYDYKGPSDNQFEVKSGYDHYKLEMDKWGMHDEQVLTGEQIKSDEANEVTYSFAASAPAKKISYYIQHQLKKDESGNFVLRPQYKIAHEYNSDNKLSKIIFYGYSDPSASFEIQRYFLLSYSNNRITEVNGYLPDVIEPYVTDTYLYNSDANISKIKDVNTNSGVTSEVSLTYLPTDKTVRADYSFSNGGAFTYQFQYDNKNIITDKTVKSDALCNTGTFVYDKNINPFKHLGYVDFLLNNYSVNNRLSEDVNYLACAFPSLIIEKYTYEYDDKGYPITSTSHYKSSDFKTQTQYFYQE